MDSAKEDLLANIAAQRRGQFEAPEYIALQHAQELIERIIDEYHPATLPEFGAFINEHLEYPLTLPLGMYVLRRMIALGEVKLTDDQQLEYLGQD